MSRRHECVLERTSDGCIIVRAPGAFDSLTSHASNTTWAGLRGYRLHVLEVEAAETLLPREATDPPQERDVGRDSETQSQFGPSMTFGRHIAELRRILLVPTVIWCVAAFASGEMFARSAGVFFGALVSVAFGLAASYPVFSIQIIRYALPALKREEIRRMAAGVATVPIAVAGLGLLSWPIEFLWLRILGSATSPTPWLLCGKGAVLLTWIAVLWMTRAAIDSTRSFRRPAFKLVAVILAPSVIHTALLGAFVAVLAVWTIVPPKWRRRGSPYDPW